MLTLAFAEINDAEAVRVNMAPGPCSDFPTPAPKLLPIGTQVMRSLLLAAVACLLPTVATPAQELRLVETLTPGTQYHVNCRVELSGKLQPPPGPMVPGPQGKAPAPPQPVAITGTSTIEYDERVLPPTAAAPQKTIRIYRRVELQRKVGDEPQESNLRQAVRRLVVARLQNGKLPFSPDGPLTWNEIDLIRTDIFIPALLGLLPERPVRIGDRWNASPTATGELTDLDRVEEGALECRLEEVVNLAGRRHAKVALAGTVRGVNEDGPTRQQLDGFYYFDLETQYLSYLSFKGTHFLLDAAGKESGRVEGRFVLARQANQRSPDLNDQALRGVVVDPNADNTLLLYDNPDLGVRLLYPRRWRVGVVQGRQVVLDEAKGSGLLLTFDAANRVPGAAQFLADSRTYLEKQSGTKVLRTYPPRPVAGSALEQFSIDVEMNGQGQTMLYYVLRQQNGGASLAARLAPADLAELQKDVERIARSVTITAPLK